MIIEGGTGPTFLIMVDQIRSLGIHFSRIKYLVLTHTHPDHTGAVPHFRRAWPHMKLLTSPAGATILGKKELFKQFQLVDLGIAQLMKAKAEVDALPDPIKNNSFQVDSIIKEGNRIDLGAEIIFPSKMGERRNPTRDRVAGPKTTCCKLFSMDYRN